MNGPITYSIDKHSSLLGTLVSYKENVLWLWHFIAYVIYQSAYNLPQ